MTVSFLKLHTPGPPQDAGKASVRKKYFVRKHQPKETKETQLLVACPAFPKVPTGPLTFAGRVKLHILPLGVGFAEPSSGDLALGLVVLCVL